MANNSSSLLPGANPTGLPQYGSEGFVPGAGTSSGTNPLLLPPNLPASAPISNPYDTSVVPTFGANSGGYSSTGGGMIPTGGTGTSSGIGGFSSISPAEQQRLQKALTSAYGDGVAAQIMAFLNSGAGYNKQAVDNMLASLQPGIERGTESLMNQFSTSGNRFGSGAQIGLADYLSQVNLNEGEIQTQMYESALNDYMNVMMGVLPNVYQEHQASRQSSILDTIGGGLIDAASIIGAPFTGGLSLAGLSLGNTLLSKGIGGGGSSGGPSYIPINYNKPSGYNPNAVDPVISGPQTTTVNGVTYDIEGNPITSAYDVVGSLTGGTSSSGYDSSGAFTGLP